MNLMYVKLLFIYKKNPLPLCMRCVPIDGYWTLTSKKNTNKI